MCALYEREIAELNTKLYHNTQLFEKTIRAMSRQKGIAVKSTGTLLVNDLPPPSHNRVCKCDAHSSLRGDSPVVRR